MPMTATMTEFHDRRMAIISTLNHARPMLNEGYENGWPGLLRLRGQLSEQMQSFQVFKHREIFNPLIARGRPQKAIAEELKSDCIALGSEYQAFQWQWANADVKARWAEYRLSGMKMMTTIRKSLLEQDEVVRKLALA